jgi:Arc/MetJ-type ribon-helix-helix transcriptional regulator
MKTLSFKVSEALDRKLAAAVKRRGRRKSDVVREALERYLDEAQGARAGSVLELAGNLAGCIKRAPRDLSTNPRHLAGLGK